MAAIIHCTSSPCMENDVGKAGGREDLRWEGPGEGERWRGKFSRLSQRFLAAAAASLRDCERDRSLFCGSLTGLWGREWSPPFVRAGAVSRGALPLLVVDDLGGE